MTDLGVPPRALTRPFDGIVPSAGAHYRLWLFAAVARLLASVARDAGSFAQAFEQFPFLRHYAEQLADQGLAGVSVEAAPAHWCRAVRAWEEGCATHLPLRAARETLALEDDDLLLLLAAALPEEDARFGALFARLQAREELRRPTLGLCAALWGAEVAVPEGVRRLVAAGLLVPGDPALPRADWPLLIPAVLWDSLRGEASPRPAAPWARHRPLDELPSLADLLLDKPTRARAQRAAALLAGDAAGIVVVRGLPGTGRRTLLGALARMLGRGLLEIDPAHAAAAAPHAGALATLLGAMPVLRLQPAPGESARLPDWSGLRGPLGITLGPQGALDGAAGPGLLHIDLALPDADLRARHWAAALGHAAPLEALATGWRIGAGQIHRLAAAARADAQLAGHAAVDIEDVRVAARELQRGALDTVARRVPGGGGWAQLAVASATQADLADLERRCRRREALAASGRDASAVGVRALFRGPSGTGKTLAARLLAGTLGKDVYRVDLAAVVNKYVGETEKNLERAFGAAEALDVVLLLDEGDALLARRTEVGSANDRYANLETNYLLQRLESFAGIVLVTTNAGERIDGAFLRRLDVVVDFTLPQHEQRRAIWSLELPARHAVGAALLDEVAQRCALSGGQIRNAALHARLLALERDGDVIDADLRAALRREYRQHGGACPLREPA